MIEAPAATETLILCVVAEATYGVRSGVVQQVEMLERITPAPSAPAFVEGVIFSRGQVIPVINLRQRFGFARADHDLRTRIVVIHHAGRTVGLLVDTAREFVTIPADAIQPPPEAVSSLSGDYLEGVATVGERLVLILHMDEVLNIAHAVAPAREE
jgi:purine-binding chemotaxis protein CheW